MQRPARTKLKVLNVPGPAGSEGFAAPALLALARVFTKFDRAFARLLADHGLSVAQFDVLATLAHGDGITQNDLAERLLVTKGNVCALIDKLQETGLVERQPDPIDRRANRLFLTTAGRRLLAKTFPAREALTRRVMAVLGEPERRALYESLARMEESLDAEE